MGVLVYFNYVWSSYQLSKYFLEKLSAYINHSAKNTLIVTMPKLARQQEICMSHFHIYVNLRNIDTGK